MEYLWPAIAAAKGEQNIKVSPAFSKAAGEREDSPAVRGKCRAATKGDGPRCGSAAPVETGREASLEKGEQTERANHPVDGLPERLCGPLRQRGRSNGKPSLAPCVSFAPRVMISSGILIILP